MLQMVAFGHTAKRVRRGQRLGMNLFFHLGKQLKLFVIPMASSLYGKEPQICKLVGSVFYSLKTLEMGYLGDSVGQASAVG